MFAYTSYTCKVDNICYNLNYNNQTATVTYSGYPHNNDYTGHYNDSESLKDRDIVIPSTITYNNVEYTVTAIGDKAFYDSENSVLMSSITIPSTVTSIGELAFYKCTNLTSIIIPSSVTTIGSSAFSNCSGLTSITIPNSITSIGVGAFDETPWYSNMPDGMVYAGKVAYKYKGTMPNNTNIEIEEGTGSISPYAFLSCSGLTSLKIPNSVTNIGDYAFYGCSGLNSVNIKSVNPVSIYSNTFSNSTNATLYVPYGCKASYEAANYWKDFKEIVENNTVNVGSSGFATYCSPNALNFSDVSAIKAYIASGFNPTTGTLVLTRVTEVTAGEGLYIVGEEGSYEIPETTTNMFYSSLLKGVISATTISPTDGSYTNFILSNGSHGIGFYTLSVEGEISAGKAYLQLPTACVAGVKAFKIAFDDHDDYATGVNSVGNNEKIEFIYNLKGERVLGPKKGLYIINGKKSLIQ